MTYQRTLPRPDLDTIKRCVCDRAPAISKRDAAINAISKYMEEKSRFDSELSYNFVAIN